MATLYTFAPIKAVDWAIDFINDIYSLFVNFRHFKKDEEQAYILWISNIVVHKTQIGD